MEIEYEASFTNIDKETMRQKLQDAGATLIKPEFLQKRRVFKLPAGHEIHGGWLWVRDEGDKINMSLKIVDGDKIENQREICLKVDGFENGCELFRMIGCTEKAYQENKRELWHLGDAEVTIDEWPFLEPFIEVEAKSEKSVRVIAQKLGLDYASAKFCAVGTLYGEKYGLPENQINNETPKIIFEMENPFL